MKTFKMSLGLFVLAASVATGRPVRADMGAVWVDEVTRSTVTLNWSDPQDSNQLASTIPVYRVSWAPVGADESVLLAYPTVLVGAASKPHTISGLDADTYYQFRVETHATWIDATGDPVNPKYRQVATIRQRTRTMAPGASLRLAGASDSSLRVEFTTPTPDAFDVIRIAYKVRWKLEELNSIAKDPVGPQTHWTSSNASCGWIDVASAPVLREALPPWKAGFPVELSKCTSYEIVAYGFNIGDVAGTLLGNVQGKTSGGRRFPRLSEAVAMDHADILVRYSRLPRQPDVSVIDFVAQTHPEIYDVRDLLIADHRDDLGNDFTALQFLSREMPEVLEVGGGSEESAPVLDIGSFVATEYPVLFAALQVELGPAVFQRGDASPNGMIDISDPMNILNFLFARQAATEISCLDAADVNDSGQVDLSDSVYMFNFLFGSGPAPASPHEECGPDTTPDKLDCEFYADCPN